jgi:hypothetical protein
VTRVTVFLGPTLALSEATAVLDADYLPPAGCGDVLRAALRRPRAIALVDGLFDRARAVWHKEILFALSEGIHVYGAASMGALRAAELDTFGMRGIGEVYRAYADGTLEDDDEVAVAHGDAGEGFCAVSDAMVDVRATLEAAVAEEVLSEGAASSIVARVKATFYPRRLLLAVLDPGDDGHELLRAWLPEGRVQRKRDDALAMLRVVRDELEAGLEPFRPTWTLQHSHFWVDARRSVELASAARPQAVSAREADDELEAVLDEVRLDPERYRRLIDGALLAALARNAATEVGVDVSVWAAQAAFDLERDHRGLAEREDAVAWLGSHGFSEDDLPDVARRLAVMRWAHAAHRDESARELELALRLGEDYPDLVARAARKRELLASLPQGGGDSIDDDTVVAWYFRERLGRDVPPSLAAWASAHGWTQKTDLIRALRAEKALDNDGHKNDVRAPVDVPAP